MSTELDRLNRLRVNAGKPELKSWKASKASLAENIQKLIDAGFTDALPGAKVDALPTTTDPEIVQTLANSALAKNKDNTSTESTPPKEKPKAKLARGLDTDQMARQSRMAVQIERERERKEAKAKRKEEKRLKKLSKKAKLSDEDKAQIKDEAADRKKGNKPKGEVDATKEPEKAARQKKHIEDKKAAREAKPKKETSDKEVTVAQICRDLGIDAKVGRAKLRRHEDKLAPLHTKDQDRWTFPKSAREIIENILNGKK